MMDGYKFRQEQQENVLAYFVAGLMNIEGKSLKRSMTPADLLKPLRPALTIEKRREDADYLREKFGLSGGGK